MWLDGETIDSILEYDSFINIYNNKNHGYLRGGMNIQDSSIEQKATEVIKQWINF